MNTAIPLNKYIAIKETKILRKLHSYEVCSPNLIFGPYTVVFWVSVFYFKPEPIKSWLVDLVDGN